jgi:hypothetical protein
MSIQCGRTHACPEPSPTAARKQHDDSFLGDFTPRRSTDRRALVTSFGKLACLPTLRCQPLAMSRRPPRRRLRVWPLREKAARLLRDCVRSKRSVPVCHTCFAKRRNAFQFALFAIAHRGAGAEANRIASSQSLRPHGGAKCLSAENSRSTVKLRKNLHTAAAYSKQAVHFKLKSAVLATQGMGTKPLGKILQEKCWPVLRLVLRPPFGNASSRSSAPYGAISVRRGLQAGSAKGKRGLRGVSISKQELGNEDNEGTLPLGSHARMAGGGAAAILAFFGVDPKKVLHVLLRQSLLLPTPWPLTPGPRAQGARGERVRTVRRVLDSTPPRAALRPRPTFLGRTPKKVPLF